MPQMLAVCAEDRGRALKLTWIYAQSNMDRKAHGVDLRSRVTLHRESVCL